MRRVILACTAGLLALGGFAFGPASALAEPLPRHHHHYYHEREQRPYYRYPEYREACRDYLEYRDYPRPYYAPYQISYYPPSGWYGYTYVGPMYGSWFRY
jgi:hypothetical protein